MFRLLLLALVASLSFMSAEAEAYQLRQTENGELVHWQKTSIEVVLDPSLEFLGPLDEVELVIIQGFELWTEQSRLDIQFEFVHGTCGDPGYNMHGDNENCVMASTHEHNWNHMDKSDPGASALVSYKDSDGIIVDADIVFNVRDWHWSKDGEEHDTLSLRKVIAHEVGHFVGLAHSDVEKAIMFPTTRIEFTESVELNEDDVSGVNTLYENVNLEEDEKTADCDGVASASGRSPSSSLIFAVFLAALWLVRRPLPISLRGQRLQGKARLLDRPRS